MQMQEQHENKAFHTSREWIRRQNWSSDENIQIAKITEERRQDGTVQVEKGWNKVEIDHSYKKIYDSK